ncbi:hypothetical protein MYP_3489 [Sporocytophaga myxococcoides]|uniref:PorV/PorQ family protein n=1 Tax=Sporocytophaga myxococcoides TaxID=153721 RepID=A0A098LH49_9BACT|nr:hypothetical protein [Sporocytophaga myxococcoides]GAL86260.1 hypothetical protein MYP_3489 [Sporocytophaga myxococcoides]
MKKGTILFIIIFCSVHFAFGQLTAPKYSNEFLNIGVGSRALGMFNVQAATVGDVTAGYWNPAGLLKIQSKYELAGMHAEYFAGMAKYDYLGAAVRLDSNSVLAINAIRFGTDEIPNTLNLYDNQGNNTPNYNNISYFSSADYAFLVSFARTNNLLPGLNLGATLKVIHRTVGPFGNAWGFGLDAGAQYVRKNWQFGLMARDVTGTYNAWSFNTALFEKTFAQTGNEIPQNSVEVTLPRLIFGVGRSKRFSKDKFGILAGMDFDFTFDRKRNVLVKSNFASIDPHVGLELDYKKLVFLRAGAGNTQQIKDFDGKTKTDIQANFGVGIKINRVSIDYALTGVGADANLYSNIFSLKLALK